MRLPEPIENSRVHFRAYACGLKVAHWHCLKSGLYVIEYLKAAGCFLFDPVSDTTWRIESSFEDAMTLLEGGVDLPMTKVTEIRLGPAA